MDGETACSSGGHLAGEEGYEMPNTARIEGCLQSYMKWFTISNSPKACKGSLAPPKKQVLLLLFFTVI